MGSQNKRLQKYYDRVGQVSESAAQFRDLFVSPILDSEGKSLTFVPPNARKSAIAEKIKGSFLEGLGDDASVVGAYCANAVVAYAGVYDSLPSDEVMAGCIGTMRSMAQSESSGGRVKMVMDSATDSMSSQDGISKRNHQIALVTPVALVQATSDFVTYVPPEHDKSEIFVIDRIAGSTFGDMNKGEKIDESFNKQYATMDQEYLIGTGDGVETTFEFDLANLSINQAAMPIREGYVRIYYDREMVAEDGNENGLLSGSFYMGETMVTVTSSGTINYTEGKGSAVFSAAPESGVPIRLRVDIDIEKAPQLIPIIEHKMRSYTVRPHEGALTVNESIQAVFAAKREYGLELRGMQITAARNALAAEKDRLRLRMMWTYAKFHNEFPRLSPAGISDTDYRLTAVLEFLNGISTEMLMSNKKSGGKGIFAGVSLINYLRSIPGFQTRPNYSPIPQPHYVGRLGEYTVFCDPSADPWKGLMIGKGQNYGDSGFVAADAISAVQYQHPMMAPAMGAGRALTHSDTLYELAYRDIHPYQGRLYFSTFEFIPSTGS